MKHTILGAGGSIGNALTYQLLKSNESVRLVSRSAYSISGAESFKADISSYQQTLDSIKGSDIVYLCAGLAYDRKVWAELWPKIMQNAIDSCKASNAKLIFFDNVYMYGKVEGKMTEYTPYKPCSAKGEIRAKTATMLEDEIKHNNIQALIARAADLYGPYITQNSVPYFMVIDKLLNGKSPQCLITDKTFHSYSYTLDCAKGLDLLWKDDNNYQQIWHLPTNNPGITSKKFIEIAADEFAVEPKYSVLKKWMIQLAGLFDKTIYETNEMAYQIENDYYFDSSKFNDAFNFVPTSYEQGIKETIAFYKK
ncbi:MAG: NAD-dependent epimerase/dehydratase family protein [Paludibacter sp.]